MKLKLPSRTLFNSFLPRNQRHFCTPSTFNPFNDDDDKDSVLVSVLLEIIRGNKSWKVAFNNTFISSNLRTHHVEKVLIQTLDDSRLALRFFNFLGLRKNFNHSLASFAILVQALAQARFFWPATSLLQTLFLRGFDPKQLAGINFIHVKAALKIHIGRIVGLPMPWQIVQRLSCGIACGRECNLLCAGRVPPVSCEKRPSSRAFFTHSESTLLLERASETDFVPFFHVWRLHLTPLILGCQPFSLYFFYAFMFQSVLFFFVSGMSLVSLSLSLMKTN